MKSFARWLYMALWREELIKVARYIRQKRIKVPGENFGDGMNRIGKVEGALDVMETLELFE